MCAMAILRQLTSVVCEIAKFKYAFDERHEIILRDCLPLYNPVMQILGSRSRLRPLVLLLACSPALAAKCSNPMVFLNSVDHDLTVHRDIRADDLEVTVDGKRAQLVSLSVNSSPRRIIVMVDVSGSMLQWPHESDWGIGLRTAAFAIDSIPSTASAALLTFSDNLQRESDGFEDRQRIGRRVLELAKRKPKGHTALFDAIDQVLSLFEAQQPGDAIFLVSDGGDDKSKVSSTKLREKLIAHGVRVFVFLVPTGLATPEEIEDQSQIDSLAEFTGGYAIRIPWSEIRGNEQGWLVKAATRISDQVQAVYQMELDASGAVVGSARRMKVAFANRKRDKKTLAYPRQLTPCFSEP
jgi:hypothetical protein